jgi:hypothetical protein
VSGNAIVGFSAAATTAGLVPGALSSPAATPAGTGSGFAQLLGALLGTGGERAAELVGAATAAPVAEAKTTELVEPLVSAAAPAKPETNAAETANGLPPDAAPLLIEFVQALTALDAALESGEPVDPLLHQQLDEALEALAPYFDLPAEPNTALATALPSTAVPGAATAPDPGSGPAAIPPAAPQPGGTPAADLPEPPPIVKLLAEKLQAMGEGVEAAEPKLAERLQAVAERLLSGRIEPQKLADLGLALELPEPEGELAKALELLLRPTASVRPAAAAPAFTAASLALPPELAASRPEKPILATPKQEPPAPAAPDRREAEPAPANRPPDRPVAAETPPAPRTPAAGAAAASAPVEAEVNPAGATAAATVTAAAAAATKTVHAAYQSPPQQINVPQVAFEMVRQFQAGNSRFQIRLDPPELGRIDIRMDMDRDGNVMARMTVERSETLDLMQRDQRALERALAQAGLDSARTSLEFSLRQQGSGREQREGSGSPVFGDGAGGGTAEPDAPAAATTTTYHRGLASPSGVNLFV